LRRERGEKDMGKSYKMVNPNNGVSVTTTEAYLIQWIARGFEVVEISDNEESSNEEEELTY
jgi:hypothetical protein